MIGLNRGRRGGDPYLDWKDRFFFAGAALALVGIARESKLLVGLALVVLVAGMVLRFLGGAVGLSHAAPSDQEEDSHVEAGSDDT